MIPIREQIEATNINIIWLPPCNCDFVDFPGYSVLDHSIIIPICLIQDGAIKIKKNVIPHSIKEVSVKLNDRTYTECHSVNYIELVA